MYSLNCSYYLKSFNTLEELIQDVVQSGMDPNHQVMMDGKNMNMDLIDLMEV